MRQTMPQHQLRSNTQTLKKQQAMQKVEREHRLKHQHLQRCTEQKKRKCTRKCYNPLQNSTQQVKVERATQQPKVQRVIQVSKV